jgi:hypothetical protein
MKCSKPRKLTENIVSYRKKWRQARIDLNLCTSCGKAAAQRLTYCIPCVTKLRMREKERRNKCKELNICLNCNGHCDTGKLRCQACTLINNKNGRDHQRLIKNTVLTHYGKNGKCKCCWDDCEVEDLDMLTLDHVDNDGAKHRREYTKTGRGGGAQLYNKLIRKGFPSGFQTLCCNHNLKKHLISLREA